MLNDRLLAMDNKEVIAMATLDFDTVDHDILLEVMRVNSGMDEPALGWYENYLKPRWMKVNVNNAISTAGDLPFSTSLERHQKKDWQ